MTTSAGTKKIDKVKVASNKKAAKNSELKEHSMSSASNSKQVASTKSTKKVAAVSTNERIALMLTNCTDTPRGIALQKGIVILQPREMRKVPHDEQEELIALFKNETFQRFVDNGIFRLSKIGDDEQCVVVKTPAPPEDLSDSISINELELSIGTATGSRAGKPRVVEHQQGGPLGEDNLPGK